MIWPCIKCSFVATIVVVVALLLLPVLLAFLVFGAFWNVCVFVCVWGAAGNHNYTRNGAHKNTSNTHKH